MPSYRYQTAAPTLYDKLKLFAAQNRKNPTTAESVLWVYLQRKQLGEAFRRQHIVGSFIADFACIHLKLLIEVDGGYHQLPEQTVSDEERTGWLKSQGFTVIRFTNNQITEDINNVIKEIKETIWTLRNNK